MALLTFMSFIYVSIQYITWQLGMLTKISMPYTTYIHYVFNVCRSYTLPQQSFTVILHMLVKSTRFLIDIISFQKILTDFLFFIVSRTFHTSCMEREPGNRSRKSAFEWWENPGGGQLSTGWKRDWSILRKCPSALWSGDSTQTGG